MAMFSAENCGEAEDSVCSRYDRGRMSVLSRPLWTLCHVKEDTMSTRAADTHVPRMQRLACLERTPENVAAAVRGQSDAILSRRPAARNWSAKEVV